MRGEPRCIRTLWPSDIFTTGDGVEEDAAAGENFAFYRFMQISICRPFSPPVPNRLSLSLSFDSAKADELANSLFHSVWRRSGNLMSSSSAHMADVSDLLLFGPVDTIQNSSPFQGEIAIAPYTLLTRQSVTGTQTTTDKQPKSAHRISARIMDCPDRHVSVC
jgi:hypothetical protein